MLKATRQDKELVTDILARSFANNNSVNYIAGKKNRRILALMGPGKDILMGRTTIQLKF